MTQVPVSQFTREQLLEAVNAPRDAFVFQFGGDSKKGFSADFLGLLTKLMYCLRYGVGFRFGKVTHPRGFVVSTGWCDYFAPFCGEVDAPLLELLNRYQFPYGRKIPVSRSLARGWLRALSRPRGRYFMFDDLRQLGLADSHLWEDEAFLGFRQGLASLLWQYTPEAALQVRDIRNAFGLPAQYICVCVRRGDKIQESPYVEVREYAAAVRDCRFDGLPVVVASDDARVVPELSSLLPGREILSLADRQSRGYVHAEFKKMPAGTRRQNTLRYFAQLEAMRDAKLFIGSESTNVAWLVNVFRAGEGMVWV